ncbi:MAG TPA: divalent cation transporter [Methanosarcinaceae archaeon]|nr:divalent cation transporter [Methanosarcinaceae archaeon]
MLLITCILGIATGQMLNSRIDSLISTPILLIMIPALIKIGGDTGSMLGARLSSAFHMGLESQIHKNPVIRNSVIAALIIGFTASIALSVIVWLVSAWMNMEMRLSTLLQISLIATSLELFVVFSATIIIAIVSHKYGLDPDDTVIPLIATIGDLVGVLGIFTAISILGII